MLHLAEVLMSHAQQCCPIHLAVSADVVMNPGMEGVPVLVVPGFLGLVLVLEEDGSGAPVVLLTREVAAPLQQQDLLPGRCELVGEGAPSRTGTDDDDVGMHGGRHETPRDGR